ncbi:MAG: hypothetical protein ACNS63_02140, partial [Candidatus Nitrospinota bacterium M3_3B_026]
MDHPPSFYTRDRGGATFFFALFLRRWRYLVVLARFMPFSLLPDFFEKSHFRGIAFRGRRGYLFIREDFYSRAIGGEARKKNVVSGEKTMTRKHLLSALLIGAI